MCIFDRPLEAFHMILPRCPLVSVHDEEQQLRTFCSGNQAPLTSGFNSSNSFTQASALDFPKLSSSTKKFTPRSSSATVFVSAIVNLPIPDLLAR